MSLSSIKPYSNLPFRGVVLPSITISPEDRATHSAAGTSNLELLTQLCRNSFKARAAKGLIPKPRHQEYGDRIKMELEVIELLGFTDYIIMVWDICAFADKQRIPRGPGRGSVAGSLVCHLIGISALDPIEHGLFFSRFLTKARAKSTMHDGVRYVDGGLVPDIDMDFSFYRRQEIIDYLITRYPGQTSKVLTTGTLTSKALIKDVLKVYENATEDQAIAASDLIQKKHGIPEELEDALSDDPEKENVQFKAWAEDHKETIEIALDLIGLNRSEGVHASALLICAYPIRDLMPLQLAAEKDGERQIVSAYDMYSSQEIVLKFDILGVKTLDVVHDVCELLKIDRDAIDVHHESIYRELQSFKRRYGVFQLETFAQGNAAFKIRPMNFEQLGMCLAIARPGAFDYLEQLIRYLHDGAYDSVHPVIDDILKPTGGVCLFQETYLAMLMRVGMDDEQAEGARKVLGKKLIEKVPEIKAKIAEVCARNKHPSEVVDLLVKIAQDSGGYSFNKSHSASYATITAWSIYLKVNHPLEFYWALLNMSRHEADGHEVIAQIEQEMRASGYQLLPPHFVHSSTGFTIEGRNIRFGLGMIRGVSEKSMVKLETFRSDKDADSKFKLLQSFKNAGLNIGIVAALIQAGCLEGYEEYPSKDGGTYRSRSRLVLEACTWNVLSDKEKTIALKIESKSDIASDVLKAVLYMRDNKDENGKVLMRQPTTKMGGRFDTIKKKYEPYKEIYELNRRNERLANFWYERTILGFSYSETLRDIFSQEIDDLVSIQEVLQSPQDEFVRFIGFASEEYKLKTQKGNDCYKFKVTDETEALFVRMFNAKIAACEEANGRLPLTGDIVLCEGQVKEGTMVFAHKVAVTTAKIYMKLSDLRDTAKTKAEKDA